jgi:hypothetical protein
MQAPIEVSRRGVGEVFSLDIPSHRMSVMGILQQRSEFNTDCVKREIHTP